MKCFKPIALLCALTLLPGLAAAETRLTLLSFNAWGGGLNEGKPVDDTLAVLQAVAPDIAGLQEMRAESSDCAAQDCPPGQGSIAPLLGQGAGLQVIEQDGPESVVWASAILTRYPVLRRTPLGLGAVLDVDGRRVAVFNIHLPDYPYQPYQLLNIPYGEAPFLATAEQAVAAARAARGDGLRLLLQELESVADTEAQFLFGDFNEPSWRDWSARAAAAGRHPLEVAWPFTRAVEAAGFVDALRAVYPDEMSLPAFTWTPTTAPGDPADHHDRIDYVFVRGAGVTVESAAIVGERAPEAGLVVAPWPSDHRAVRAVVCLDCPGSEPPRSEP